MELSRHSAEKHDSKACALTSDITRLILPTTLEHAIHSVHLDGCSNHPIYIITTTHLTGRYCAQPTADLLWYPAVQEGAEASETGGARVRQPGQQWGAHGAINASCALVYLQIGGRIRNSSVGKLSD